MYSYRSREIQGMIAAYILMNDHGYYLVSEEPVVYSEDWSRARSFFGAEGLMQLREVRRRMGGTIMIVNSYPPTRYYKQ